MFNFLTTKERGILLIGPIVLVLLIIFLGFEANYWRKEMLKEEQLKLKWQNSYIELNHSIQNFAEQQAQLIQAVNNLKAKQNQQTQDLKNVLKSNQDWADSPLPDDVKRLLTSAGTHSIADSLSANHGMQCVFATNSHQWRISRSLFTNTAPP